MQNNKNTGNGSDRSNLPPGHVVIGGVIYDTVNHGGCPADDERPCQQRQPPDQPHNSPPDPYEGLSAAELKEIELRLYTNVHNDRIEFNIIGIKISSSKSELKELLEKSEKQKREAEEMKCEAEEKLRELDALKKQAKEKLFRAEKMQCEGEANQRKAEEIKHKIDVLETQDAELQKVMQDNMDEIARLNLASKDKAAKEKAEREAAQAEADRVAKEKADGEAAQAEADRVAKEKADGEAAQAYLLRLLQTNEGIDQIIPLSPIPIGKLSDDPLKHHPHPVQNEAQYHHLAGEAQPPKEAGEAQPPKEAGEAQPPKEAGEAQPPKEAGEAQPPKEAGEARRRAFLPSREPRRQLYPAVGGRPIDPQDDSDAASDHSESDGEGEVSEGQDDVRIDPSWRLGQPLRNPNYVRSRSKHAVEGKRGRTKGSKNKPKVPQQQAEPQPEKEKQKAGRKEGAKNKPRCTICGKEMGEGGMPDQQCALCKIEYDLD